jgi:hypothetical protein
MDNRQWGQDGKTHAHESKHPRSFHAVPPFRPKTDGRPSDGLFFVFAQARQAGFFSDANRLISFCSFQKPLTLVQLIFDRKRYR